MYGMVHSFPFCVWQLRVRQPDPLTDIGRALQCWHASFLLRENSLTWLLPTVYESFIKTRRLL
jgi:hypothetical protein